MHRRRWRLQAQRLEIEDEVIGRGEHQVECHFHLHPDVQVSDWDVHSLRLRTADGRALARVELDPGFEWSLREGRWYPGFGLAVPNRQLHGRWRGALPLRCMTTLRLEN